MRLRKHTSALSIGEFILRIRNSAVAAPARHYLTEGVIIVVADAVSMLVDSSPDTSEVILSRSERDLRQIVICRDKSDSNSHHRYVPRLALIVLHPHRSKSSMFSVWSTLLARTLVCNFDAANR